MSVKNETKKATKQMGKKSLSQVNEVPLSDVLEQAAEKLLRAVKDNEWSEGYESKDGTDFEGITASALVLVFRPDGKGGIDVNALNEGLGDDYQKLMTEAALKAISGKPLFYTWG